MPRPDLAALGVNYRRIPVLSIGRDIFTDTRLILSKLETLNFSGSKEPLGASTPSEKALEKLLSKWTIETNVFGAATALLPENLPVMKDPKFRKDREDFSGRSWQNNDMKRARPEALVVIRDGFAFLEETVLADGRTWVLGEKGPLLADIEGKILLLIASVFGRLIRSTSLAIWPFQWLATLPGSLPETLISAKQYPKTFAWIGRFNQAIKAARSAAPQPKTLKGPEALKEVTSAEWVSDNVVDENDPMGLKERTQVEIYPIESGGSGRDRGALVGLTKDEIVVETKAENGTTIRIHHPRIGFRVNQVSGDTKL